MSVVPASAGVARTATLGDPTGAEAVAAASKAADTARERAAGYLLATRLQQLPERAASRLGGEATGAVIT
ncbi:hypothetical protein [Streptomyces sp. NPDC005955]|uniref:hypothetical protein n=1 Tax=Streptomyces sp. NPDC005955 TaxID=3364738 RepID=UPI0036AE7025